MTEIDKEKCLGCGACESICPNGFEIINGKAIIKDENADCLKDAANSCPVNAIKINKNK